MLIMEKYILIVSLDFLFVELPSLYHRQFIDTSAILITYLDKIRGLVPD